MADASVPATNQAGEVAKAYTAGFEQGWEWPRETSPTEAAERYARGYVAALATQPATSQEGERKRFKPGKLNERQRSYIILASKFVNGSPVPFCEMNVPETGMASYRGLLTRGLMEETKTGFAKLTATGWEVASAIHRLAGRERDALEIEAWVKSNG